MDRRTFNLSMIGSLFMPWRPNRLMQDTRHILYCKFDPKLQGIIFDSNDAIFQQLYQKEIGKYLSNYLPIIINYRNYQPKTDDGRNLYLTYDEGPYTGRRRVLKNTVLAYGGDIHLTWYDKTIILNKDYYVIEPKDVTAVVRSNGSTVDCVTKPFC